jgi:hypothetical protein
MYALEPFLDLVEDFMSEIEEGPPNA